MGWKDEHLHGFTINREAYGDECEPTDVTLESVLGVREKLKFEYCYDFGDSWDHVIVVESIVHLGKPLEHAVCLNGARACPPEDCGGIWAYQDRLRSANSDEDSTLFGA